MVLMIKGITIIFKKYLFSFARVQRVLSYHLILVNTMKKLELLFEHKFFSSFISIILINIYEEKNVKHHHSGRPRF